MPCKYNCNTQTFYGERNRLKLISFCFTYYLYRDSSAHNKTFSEISKTKVVKEIFNVTNYKTIDIIDQ